MPFRRSFSHRRPFDSSSSFHLPVYNFASYNRCALRSSHYNIVLALALTSLFTLHSSLHRSPFLSLVKAQSCVLIARYTGATDVCLFEISRHPCRTRSFQLHRVQRERTLALSLFCFGIAFLVTLFSHNAACALFRLLSHSNCFLSVGSSVLKAVSLSFSLPTKRIPMLSQSHLL